MSEKIDQKRASDILPGFYVSDDGVQYTNEKEETAIICSRLDIIAKTRSNENENWGLLLKFKDDDGIEHSWPMPMELLSGDGNEYRSRLLSMGLKIAPGRMLRDKLAMYLITAKTEKRARGVSQVGWHGQHFILPDEAIGPESNEIVCLQLLGETKHRMITSGTLVDWQENIASLCRGNSGLIFGISSAFAAPLLTTIGEEGGGFHLRSSSSTGKSTTLAVAGSVWGGGGQNGYIENWRNTTNGLEATAAQHNDSLLVLDELGQCDPKDAGDAAYMLSNGAGKGRANRFGDGRRRVECHSLFHP